MLNFLLQLFIRLPLKTKLYYGAIFALTFYIISFFFSFLIFLLAVIFGFNLVIAMVRKFFPQTEAGVYSKDAEDMIEINPRK